ncbi:MAG: hypothetical protein J7L42_02480, partial [Elusimicrobia bacterium]|nr:hypothetical protein [Elusimicrobiota bacterium]
FRVEEATRYRYAKLIAQGKKIPEIDRRIQYPEGLKVNMHFTTLSQRTLGTTYRIFGVEIPFHIYVIYFMFLYSSLSIFAVFLVSNVICENKIFSIIATLFYATSFASSSRTIAGGLVEEDFALPLMFFSFFFFLYSFKKTKKIYSWISGFLLGLALISWHVSQFFYLILSLFIFIIYAFKEKERGKIFQNFLPLLIFASIFGIFSPILRGGYFLLSFSQIAGYSFVFIHLFFKKKNPLKILLVFILSFCFLFLISRPITSKHTENYAHVYLLMWSKIKNLGSKPSFYEDVKKLPFDAKVLWQSSFVSPDFKFVKDLFLIVFIFSLAGFFQTLKIVIRRKSTPEILNLGLLFSFFILFLLIRRLYVFVIFFLSAVVASGGNLFSKNKKLYALVVLLYSAGVVMQTKQTLPRLKAIPRRINEYKQDLLKWMNKNLPPGSVILSNIGFAPEIVQNSTFKTVLHNHYEAKDIRDKTKEFYQAIYEDEEVLWNFARKYGAQYLIYHWEFLLDKSKNSVRYQVDRMTVFKKSACYKLHFREKELKHFELLYQNEYYRLFRVLEANEKPHHRKVRYVPFFDERVFVPKNKIVYLEGKQELGEIFDDDFAKEKMDKVWGLPNMRNRAKQLEKEGKILEAENLYLKMLEIDPYFDRTRLLVADFYMRHNMPQKAIPHLIYNVKYYPTKQNYSFLISALKIAGEKELVKKYLIEARKKFPDIQNLSN